MSDLKPCPCCGSEAVIFEQYKKDGYRIKCKNCALKREQRTLCYSMEWLESKMKENWNNRSIDKQIAQLKADKAELLECISGFTSQFDDEFINEADYRVMAHAKQLIQKHSG